jgi:hypothetical protein
MQCAVCGRKIDWPLEHCVAHGDLVYCVQCDQKRQSDAWRDELEVCANLQMKGVK